MLKKEKSVEDLEIMVSHLRMMRKLELMKKVTLSNLSQISNLNESMFFLTFVALK